MDELIKSSVVLVGFDVECYEAFKKADIHAKVWISTRKFRDVSARKFEQISSEKDIQVLDFTFGQKMRFSWIDRTSYNDLETQKFIHETFQECLPYYYRFFSRQSWDRIPGLSIHEGFFWSWTDVNNQIYKALYFFLDMFVKNNFDAVIFDDIPHDSVIVLLQIFARKFGVQIIVCKQIMCFKDRFFISLPEEIKEISSYNNLLGSKNNERLELPTIKQPVYMEKIASERFFRFCKIVLKDIPRIVIINICLLWGFRRSKYVEITRKFIVRTTPFPITFHGSKDINSMENFVYFPFQVQPEMTADVLGLEYGDQLLALEKLSSLIPENWKIYCKEHPKQTLYARESSFVERLKSIPKIKIIHVGCSTYELIRKCRFVATISGTAGWEAIHMGKRALTFGDAFYNELYGAVKISEVLDMDPSSVCELMTKKFDFNALKKSFYDFQKYLHQGIIHGDSLPISIKHSRRDNAENISSALVQAMKVCRERKFSSQFIQPIFRK